MPGEELEKEERDGEEEKEESQEEKEGCEEEKSRQEKEESKRKPSAAFMKAMKPSAALAEVVGAKPLPRTQVVKKLWAYIKKHKLQDKVNRRMINADAVLKVVFGGKRKVSMFEMTKLVNKHLK